jgi:hypothetical protein
MIRSSFLIGGPLKRVIAHHEIAPAPTLSNYRVGIGNLCLEPAEPAGYSEIAGHLKPA